MSGQAIIRPVTYLSREEVNPKITGLPVVAAKPILVGGPEQANGIHTTDILDVVVEITREKDNDIPSMFDFLDDAMYEEFAKFFSELELMLRMASYKIYKLYLARTNPNTDEEAKLISEYNNTDKKKEFLERITDVIEPVDLLVRWYDYYNPAKLEDLVTLDRVITRYQGCYDVMFSRLYKKYVDEEYIDKPLWFGQCDQSMEVEIDVPPRKGMIESIQQAAELAPLSNYFSTFQPKTALLPTPRRPISLAIISEEEGDLDVATLFQGLELSGTSTRPTTPLILEEAPVELEIDINKIKTGRGGYTMNELRDFLSLLDIQMKKSATKTQLATELLKHV